jgi:hypothetical protein
LGVGILGVGILGVGILGVTPAKYCYSKEKSYPRVDPHLKHLTLSLIA